MRTRSTIHLESRQHPGPFYRSTTPVKNPSGPEGPYEYIDTQNAASILMDYDEETITDDPSSGREFKEVTHVRRKLHRVGVSDDVQVLDVDANGTTIRSFHALGPLFHWYNWGQYGEITHDMISVDWPIELEAQRRKLAHSFYALNEVDNLTNLVESPGLISGLQSFKRDIMSSARNAVKKARSVRLVKEVVFKRDLFSPNKVKLDASLQYVFKAKDIGYKTNLAKAISGAYLYYSFGIAPLISDMKKIYASVAKIDEQLKRNRNHAGKVVNLHSTVQGKAALDIADTRYGSPGTAGAYWDTTILGDRPKRVVTVQGMRIKRYETQAFQDLDFRLRKFLSGGPASFLWERIPYSFVVDWFVDLSGVVDSLDRFLTNNPANIAQTCYSIYYNLRFPVRKHPYMPYWPEGTMDWTITAHNELSYYHRKPISSDLSIGTSGRFGKKQAALSAALLTQIVSNLRSIR